MSKRLPSVIHRPPPMECCACHARLGAKELPIDVRDDDGDGRGKVERWCPQCFVFTRAHQDDRWRDAVLVGQILAISCLKCGVTSVDFGQKKCAQCGARAPHIVMQLPKGTVLRANTLRSVGLVLR